MRSKLIWLLLQHLRKVWVRVVAFALLAIVTAALAQLVGDVIPGSWATKIGAESVDHVLDILASSMLAVTIFSLAIAISAFASAAGNATPRATALLQEDSTAQNILATFLGAFLFSLVGIIAMEAGYYSQAGRLVLFVVTTLVIATVVVALLRWISHLMTFGRMGDTLDRVERAATRSLKERIQSPALGGRPYHGLPPASAQKFLSREAGYLLHLDVGALQLIAKELDGKIWVCALPGTFVHEASPLVQIDADDFKDEVLDRIQATFTIGAERSFDQDPRFGLIVITEIASRALSPAVNDPGTAISVIGRLVRILSLWKENIDAEVEHDLVQVPLIQASDVLEDAFRPIIRDGATIFEVQLRIQKALKALSLIAPEVFGLPATKIAVEARSVARESLLDHEYSLLGKG